MEQAFLNHFENLNLDIRKRNTGYSRFIDQKVTPDVLSFVSDCILNLVNDRFTVRDIWESNYFVKNTIAIFGKPSPLIVNAFSEYNKFISQPLKTLSFSGVLTEVKIGNANHYSITNKSLLSFIAMNDRNAFIFLHTYLEKVLTDSGFYPHILKYTSDITDKDMPKDETYTTLKLIFKRFIIGHTEIRGTLEVNRLFPKVLNIFSVKLGVPGSEKGKVTDYPFAYSDLMYNRKNFRDLRKNKGVPRADVLTELGNSNEYTDYLVEKAKKIIRNLYRDSEIKDQSSRGVATYVHHILPKADYPKFAAYLENLIKLTPEQHFGKAHPLANTRLVDSNYQLTCLLSKLTSIEQSIACGESIYDLSLFIELINTRFHLNMSGDTSPVKVREQLLSLQALS